MEADKKKERKHSRLSLRHSDVCMHVCMCNVLVLIMISIFAKVADKSAAGGVREKVFVPFRPTLSIKRDIILSHSLSV